MHRALLSRGDRQRKDFEAIAHSNRLGRRRIDRQPNVPLARMPADERPRPRAPARQTMQPALTQMPNWGGYVMNTVNLDIYAHFY